MYVHMVTLAYLLTYLDYLTRIVISTRAAVRSFVSEPGGMESVDMTSLL